jgi:hypothetical protein
MICYICHQPSVGQCQACWKFYCESHGDVACQPCQQQLDAAHQPGRGTGRISVRQDVRRQSASPGSAPPPSPEEQPLQRVIGVTQTAGQGETEVTLVSLELYAAGFIANFRLRGKPPNQPITGPFDGIFRPNYYPEASDDLGNVYYGSPRGGGGGSHESGGRLCPLIQPL